MERNSMRVIISLLSLCVCCISCSLFDDFGTEAFWIIKNSTDEEIIFRSEIKSMNIQPGDSAVAMVSYRYKGLDYPSFEEVVKLDGATICDRNRNILVKLSRQHQNALSTRFFEQESWKEHFGKEATYKNVSWVFELLPGDF